LLLLAFVRHGSTVQGQEDPTTTPTATPGVSLSIDADPGTPGIQESRTVGSSTFTVDIVVQDLPRPMGVFQFSVIYDQTVMNAPTLGAPIPPLDRNPDANQEYLNAGGSDFNCVAASGDRDPDPGIGAAMLTCETLPGPGASGDGVLATLTFHAVSAGSSDLGITSAVLGDRSAAEISTCNPVIAHPMLCYDASITLADVTPIPTRSPTPTATPTATSVPGAPTSTATPTATPAPSTPTPQWAPALRIDANPDAAGIQSSRTVTDGTFDVAIVTEGTADYPIGVFAFEILYDQTVIDAPNLGPPLPFEDRNPDMNESFVNSQGGDFTCIEAWGDRDPSPETGEASITCTTSLITLIGITGSGVLATLEFNVVGEGSSELTLQSGTLGHVYGGEMGTCNPELSYPLDCQNASITVAEPTPTPPASYPPGVGGAIMLPPAAVAAESGTLSEDDVWPAEACAAFAGGVLLLAAGGWYAKKRRLR
jgi:hypothetical protein